MVDETRGAWEADTRVFAWDRAAVEAVRERAALDGIRVPLDTTRRGVPFVVLPGMWLITLGEDWGMAVPNVGYIRDVVRHHEDERIAKPLEPGEGLYTGPLPPIDTADDEPPELGKEYQAWEL